MTSPSCWFASADSNARPETSEYERIALGTKQAVEMLQDADRRMAQRLDDLDSRGLSAWPGELRIYIERGADLLADPVHGRQAHRLMLRLTRSGRRAGIRLEVQS